MKNNDELEGLFFNTENSDGSLTGIVSFNHIDLIEYHEDNNLVVLNVDELRIPSHISSIKSFEKKCNQYFFENKLEEFNFYFLKCKIIRKNDEESEFFNDAFISISKIKVALEKFGGTNITLLNGNNIHIKEDVKDVLKNIF